MYSGRSSIRRYAAARHFSGDTWSPYEFRGWSQHPRVVDVPSFGHRNVKVLNGGLKKWRPRPYEHSG